MKKWIIPVAMILVVLFTACSGTSYTPNYDLSGITDVPLYPGNTGIKIDDAESILPDIIFSTTGAENGLVDTVYLIEGKVTDRGIDGEYPYFTVTTKKGAVWISDVSSATASPKPNQQTRYNLKTLETYYPLPEIGELVRVHAQYQGMSAVNKYPCFVYGSADYLAKSLARSSLNPLIAAELQSIPLFNGSKTEILSSYAYIEISKADLKQITAEDYEEFCAEIVADSHYNWVTIKCDDGTGINFPGSQYTIATYGKLDREGIVTTSIGDILQIPNGFEYKPCD